MMKLQFIILTKSSKYSGFCVAGIGSKTGKWYRLVTQNENSHGVVRKENLKDENGRECELLDEVSIVIDKKCGDEIQPENVLFNTSYCLTFVRKVTLKEVFKKHPPEVHRVILGNPYPYIKKCRINLLDHSLELIQVTKLRVYHTTNNLGKPKTKADFNYGFSRYEGMSVTDYRYYRAAEGLFYEKACLVISIGTPLDERYYKFVSAIYV